MFALVKRSTFTLKFSRFSRFKNVTNKFYQFVIFHQLCAIHKKKKQYLYQLRFNGFSIILHDIIVPDKILKVSRDM